MEPWLVLYLGLCVEDIYFRCLRPIFSQTYTNVPYEPLSRQKARWFQNPQEILGIVEISCKLSDLCRNMSILSFCFLNEVNSLNFLEGSHLMS